MNAESLNSMFLLGMWLIPTMAFIAPAFFLYHKGSLPPVFSPDGNEKGNWLIPNISFLIATVAGITYAVLGHGYPLQPEWLIYLGFEYVQSGIIWVIILASSNNATEFKQQQSRDNSNFGIDLEKMGAGKYFVKLVASGHGSNKYLLQLYKTVVASDKTGNYVVVRREFIFLDDDELANFTKGHIVELLKGYFDNQRFFNLDIENGIVLVEKEKGAPEVLVIK